MSEIQRVLEEMKTRVEGLPRLRIEFGGSSPLTRGLEVVPDCVVRDKILAIIDVYLAKVKYDDTRTPR